MRPIRVKQSSNTKLLDLVRKTVKDYISERNLSGGDPLPTEKELAENLGISRTAIREALKGLQELGVIESIQGKGYFLRDFNFDAALAGLDFMVKPDLKAFRDLLEIRMYMESAFLVRDVFKCGRDDIDELRQIAERMRALVERGVEEEELVDLHTSFHRRLYKNSGNVFLLELINMFSAMQHKFIAIHEYRTSDRHDFARGHEAIVDALALREPEVVRSALINHFSEPLAWVQGRMALKANQAEGG